MSRAVGEVVAVPKLATPEMVTAGPTRSLAGASRRLRVTWARVSLIALAESTHRLLRASVWSVLSRLVPRLTSFSPPALRALSLLTS